MTSGEGAESGEGSRCSVRQRVGGWDGEAWGGREGGRAARVKSEAKAEGKEGKFALGEGGESFGG